MGNAHIYRISLVPISSVCFQRQLVWWEDQLRCMNLHVVLYPAKHNGLRRSVSRRAISYLNLSPVYQYC